MDALKVIESFEALIKPILALKPAIEQAKAAERTVKDLEIRRAKAEQDLQNVEARIKAKHLDLENAKLTSEKQIEDSRNIAIKIRNDAKVEAAEILKAANEARDLLSLSNDKLKTEAESLKATIDSRKTEILKMRQEYNSVSEQRTKAFAELEKLFKARA